MIQSILNDVDTLDTEKEVYLFSQSRRIDFSQFKPRGHYTKTEELERYFKAMIWLGRIDFRVADWTETDPQELMINTKQLIDAYLIWRSVEESGSRSAWDDLDKMIGFMIGEPDAMNLQSFGLLMEASGVSSLEDLLDEQIQSKILQIMEEKGYGDQRICSYLLDNTNLGEGEEVKHLPKSFAFMGQRFAVDSHVFSNVVYDRIVVNNKKIERGMPSPLDAMFVLGNNRALHHLESELTYWNYQKNISLLRYLVDQYETSFWESSVYNEWLYTLQSLSGPFEEADGYPDTLRTAAYQDKLLHTQLASWAEIRHDTILYVKQSYSLAWCEYPDGYVEPIPEFYRRLKQLASKAQNIYENAVFDFSLMREAVVSYYQNLADIMEKLENLAQKQLNGQARTDEETRFIKDTIIKSTLENGCNQIPYYTGWYPELFYDRSVHVYSGYINSKCVTKDYLVADVHTNPNYNGGILHVGVGKVNTIFFTAQTPAGPALFVGPVFSYYEYNPGMTRINDSEWADLIDQDLLDAPPWTQTFLIESARE